MPTSISSATPDSSVTDCLAALRTTFLAAMPGIAMLLLMSQAYGAETAVKTSGSESRTYSITEQRAPCTDFSPTRKPHFGDTHVHTAWSFDANSQDTRNKPIDAYNFAKGNPMQIQPYNDEGVGQRTIQIDRPLDFTAVTDHSEFMGEMRMCNTRGSKGYWHPVCIQHRWVPQWSFATFAAYSLAGKNRWGLCGDDNEDCFAAAADTWADVQQATEQAYDRSAGCKFTSFNGYEWTASVGSGNNLHHNVVFRNEHVPERALSWVETPSQVDLWDYLDKECVADKPGCDAVVIPHNSNLSGGLMFETARLETESVPAEPVTANEAARRARWNTLFELVQHKGSSECDNRGGWVADEFCDFEKMGYDTFGGKNTGIAADGALEWMSWFVDSEALPTTQLPDETNFLRFGLKKGLQQQAELGANSFKFGVIGSTDTHIAAPGLTMEKNHPGHGGAGMGSRDGVPKGLPDELEYGPGGLAVLYAEENTRDSLFAAMQRREAYATSGTRPVIRFFGGWDYAENLCEADDLLEQGYAAGVPMGGDLPPRQSATSPVFVATALADAGTSEYPGSDLQRIQVVKGWHKNGQLEEKVLDIAGGPNDASVDLDSCEQTGSGHKQLCAVWTDKEFEADAEAFYYIRVLENPSCRWSQQICAAAGVQCDKPETVSDELQNCCATEHKKTIQERAWSSPIWYSPEEL